MEIKNAFGNRFCVYAHSLTDGTVIYVGSGRIGRAFSNARTFLWHKTTRNRSVSVTILGWFTDRQEAFVFEAEMIEKLKPSCNKYSVTPGGTTRSLGPRPGGKKSRPAVNRAIRCVETGVVYPTSRAAQFAFGVSQAAISNVLNGRSKTIRGFTFERVRDLSQELFEHRELANPRD